MNMSISKIALAVFVVLLIVASYFVGKLQRSDKTEKVASSTAADTAYQEPTPTTKPTITPTSNPTSIPTKAPTNQTTSSNNCDKIIGDLMNQYNNLYTTDDILIANNMECHYHLLRQNNLEVNDGHIRDQLLNKSSSTNVTSGGSSSNSSNAGGSTAVVITSGLTYYSTGSGHWVSKKIDSGKYIKLEDGSLWEISPLDKINTILWLTLDDITVIESDNLLYPYILVNTDDDETAEAKLIAR